MHPMNAAIKPHPLPHESIPCPIVFIGKNQCGSIVGFRCRYNGVVTLSRIIRECLLVWSLCSPDDECRIGGASTPLLGEMTFFWYRLPVNIDRPLSQLNKSLCSVFFGEPSSPLQPEHPIADMTGGARHKNTDFILAIQH
jgi:hypothetical protein